MKKSTYLMLAIGLFTLLVTLVVAGCCHRTPEQRAEHLVTYLVSTLKLDAAQTAKLEKMKEDYLAKLPEMMKAREETLKDVKELMLSPQLDQAKLNARMEKVQTHANEVIRFVFAEFAELHDLLTPEQRTKLVEEMEKHIKSVHHW